MRTALVILHAAPGLLALIAGLPAFSPTATGRRLWWRHVYAACVATMIVGLVILLVYDWGELDVVPQVAFSGLTVLALVMGYRVWRGYAEAAQRNEGWRTRYVDHIFFTYVALWIGLFVVPALNFPLPQVTIPVMIVVVLGIGHLFLTRYKRRLTHHEVAA